MNIFIVIIIVRHVCVLNFTSSRWARSFCPDFLIWVVHQLRWSALSLNVWIILTWSWWLSVLRRKIQMFRRSTSKHPVKSTLCAFIHSFIRFNMIKNSIKELVSVTYRIHCFILHLCNIERHCFNKKSKGAKKWFSFSLSLSSDDFIDDSLWKYPFLKRNLYICEWKTKYTKKKINSGV